MVALTTRRLLVSGRKVGTHRCRSAVRRFATHADSSSQEVGERYSVVVSQTGESVSHFRVSDCYTIRSSEVDMQAAKLLLLQHVLEQKHSCSPKKSRLSENSRATRALEASAKAHS